MQIHNLVQGSPEWQQFRLQHFGASEAAAMLGLSKKVKRSELLHMKHTGTPKEFSEWVQANILDYGHEVEALARPHIEEDIGEDLYPVTCSAELLPAWCSRQLSASCDGLTMGEDVAFEHKQWNEALAAAVRGGELPEDHMPQCQQILMVTGAKKVIFTVSDGTREKRVYMDVYPDPVWFDRIRAGWEQFERDLAEYTPPEVVAEVVGRSPETLPALRIEVTGKVTASNLTEYKAHALEVFKGINRTLTTDQDFANADKAAKWCGDVEERLAAAKQHALSQTESIDALFRAIDEISAEARATRLELEKLVKARKEQIRNEILQDGVLMLQKHVTSLNERLGKNYMPAVPADFAGAMKGKKTVASLRDAVSTTLANAKIEANAVADRIDVNLKALREQAKDHAFLFADTAQLVLKAPEDCQATITARLAEHKAAEDKRLTEERERIASEERAKAEAEAKTQMAATTTRTQAMMESHQERREAGAQCAEEKVVTILDNDPEFASTAPAAPTIAPAVAAIRQVVDTGARLRLGEINARIAPLAITVEGLAQLGYPHVETDKSAKLYRVTDFPAICAAIARHVAAVPNQVARAA